MTIFEISSILLNAIIGVLIVGYGIWLRNVFNHQIKAKDATIEAKDAEISRLRADAAPAIADAYAKMRAHANQMAADVNLLNQKLDDQTKVLPQDRLRVEAQTQIISVQRLLGLIGPTPQGDYEAFSTGRLSIFSRDVHRRRTKGSNNCQTSKDQREPRHADCHHAS